MTITEVKDYLPNLISHITFDYNGYSCGVDPLAVGAFDMWYGNKEITVKSIDEVLNTKFFDGESLTDIWDDVTELDY